MSLAILSSGCSNHADEKQKIADTFRDPASVKFEDFHVYRGDACGRVNAVNGFGAYVGFKDFIAYGAGGDTPFVDYGPEIITPADLRQRIETDNEACRVATKNDRANAKFGLDPTAPQNQCSWEQADVEKFKAGEKFVATFQQCMTS